MKQELNYSGAHVNKKHLWFWWIPTLCFLLLTKVDRFYSTLFRPLPGSCIEMLLYSWGRFFIAGCWMNRIDRCDGRLDMLGNNILVTGHPPSARFHSFCFQSKLVTMIWRHQNQKSNKQSGGVSGEQNIARGYFQMTSH